MKGLPSLKLNGYASLEGFKNGANIAIEYTYDQNGNMLSDANKGITGIVYNHLNLPTQVTMAGQNISYIYDAVGTKLRKTVSGITTDYAGNYVYENGTLQFFNHAEGYVEPNGTGWQYVYQYKDHLGNVRLSYADSNGDGVISPSSGGGQGEAEIREENNFYPFGLKHKGYNFVVNGRDHKYGFGNKEEQDELGLGWIDITARNYDPALGRWMNLDPLAEAMRRHSPYNYAFDNPVYFIDPDGNLPQSGRQETDATRSQREQLDAQKKQEDVQKAFGFLVDKGVIKNNSSSGATGGEAKVGTVEGEQGTFGAPISENGGGDDKGKKLSGGQYDGKNSGDITNKRDFNGFTLDVREVTDLSHEEAFDLFENVFKERQNMFDDMMEWIDKSGYIIAADVKTLIEELKKGNLLRLSAAAMMEYAKWKTSKVSSQNEGIFKEYIGLHVKDPSQMKGIIQIYERFGVSIYEDVTVHYYDRSTGKYLGKVD